MTGFLHLNDANSWTDFDLGTEIAIEHGALALKKAGATYARNGAFVAGPISIGNEPVAWFRVRASMPPLRVGEHLELFTQTSDSAPTPVILSDDVPFADPKWHQAPRDLADALIPGLPQDAKGPLFPGAASRQLWIGGVLRGTGETTPRIEQMRVDYGRDTTIGGLPAVYRRDPVSRERLERLLALEETPFRELDALIVDLPALCDPSAAPAGEPPAWLRWLAGWLDFDLTDRWSEAETRALIATAFERYGARGTIEGLRRSIQIYTGVTARITEPAAAVRIWSLGQTSTLGFTTQLASGSASGAVLDSTATLDASHLTRGERFGATLFEDVAHRFCVDVYCADLRTPRLLDEVRAVIDREKPAHTVYAVRTIDARLRVGLQARVGVDAIVADGPALATIGTVLRGDPLGHTQTDCKNART